MRSFFSVSSSRIAIPLVTSSRPSDCALSATDTPPTLRLRHLRPLEPLQVIGDHALGDLAGGRVHGRPEPRAAGEAVARVALEERAALGACEDLVEVQELAAEAEGLLLGADVAALAALDFAGLRLGGRLVGVALERFADFGVLRFEREVAQGDAGELGFGGSAGGGDGDGAEGEESAGAG